MERQVEKYIHNLPDIDLLVYIRTETHLPEALEFARIELADRHFTAEHLTELEQQLRQRQIEQLKQQFLEMYRNELQEVDNGV